MAQWGTQGASEEPLAPRPSPQRLPRGLQRAKVFVVDDDALARRVVIELLSTRFEAYEFSDGESALNALGHIWPDVVLLDVVLPGLDGVEICRRMKQRAEERVLPVILVTGVENLAERIRGMEAGADDFLIKPVHKVELRARVGNLVKLSYYDRLENESTARLDTMKRQLEEADRLATLGTFAGGVGHEINNIATVLHSVEGDMNESALADDLKADLMDATRRLQELARAMQRIARPVQVEQQIDVREIVRDVMWMTRITGRTKYVKVDFDEPQGAVIARLVPVQLQQVVMNLVTNAADALLRHPTGRIRISLSCDTGLVTLCVEDNGPGMSPEARAHLFEPLFTTKQAGLGTGLGLALVRQLVTSWGGTVELHTRLGEGTCVEVRFPCERAGRAS